MEREKNEYKKDIAEVVGEVMRQTKDVKSNETNVSDLVFKGLSTISLALVTWILTTVNGMQKENAASAVKQQNIIENLSKLNNKVENLTSMPKFTAENFNQNIIPLTNQVNINTSELNNRNNFMSETKNKIQQLELKINILESKNGGI